MFDKQPAIVELFGRQQIAGHVTEAVLGGQAFFRVDVPAVNGTPGFTKIFGAAAIYAISPCDEAAMQRAAAAFQAVPIVPWVLASNDRLALPQSAEDAREEILAGLEDLANSSDDDEADEF